jgi:hypothetical protein
MQCKKCNSKWEIDRSISASLASCPFCGASLVDDDDGEPKLFDSSKAALIYIAQKHGSAVLLGKQLKSFFADYTPQVSKNIKKLVFAVYENDAASILQKNLDSSQADKEIAFKQAVAKLTEAFIAQEAAENIIGEFATALGWQLSIPTQAQSQPTVQQKSVTNKQVAQPQPQPQPQPKPVYQTGTSSIAGITPGKTRNIQFGEYTWRVLDVQGDKALLLTEDVIEKRLYNEQYTDVTWENCTLRHYLNNEFYSKFSSQEQARILPTINTNANNQWFNTRGGNDTTDKIFLLSIEEVVRYFGDSGQLKNKNPNSKYYINDKFNKERVATCGGWAWWWWLRSPGYGGYCAARVDADGGLYVFGSDVRGGGGGVRPALWLNLKS